MHLDQPYYCHAIAHLYQHFQTGYPIRSVTWPGSVQDAHNASLIELSKDGKISIQSEDSSARLVLSPHGKRFAVCYPLQISQHNCRYNYVWQTQLFSVRDFPERWSAALNLARIFQNDNQKNFCKYGKWQQQQQNPISQLPQLPDELLNHDWGTGLKQELWWKECSIQTYPKNALIQMEWTPIALYQFIPQVKEVEVWLHQDESCLYTEQNGKFFHHLKMNGKEQVFALSAIPKNIWDDTATFRYEFETTATKALLFREAAIQFLNSQMCAYKENNSNVDDVSAVEVDVCEEVAGEGVFCLYCDGRVHVKFLDRTILKMDVENGKIDMILNNGTKRQLTIQTAYGVEDYVKKAMDFYCCATQPYTKQLHNLQGQTRVLQELEKNVVLQRQCEQQTPGSVERKCAHVDDGQKTTILNTLQSKVIPNLDDLSIVDVQERETLINEWLEQNSKLLSTLDDMLT